MPTTIVLFDSISSTGAQTGGTWAYVGTTSPAPTAPGTYNGTADFSACTVSTDYPFEYTVNGVTSTVTVAYMLNPTAYGDTCDTALNYVWAGDGRTIDITGYTNGEVCSLVNRTKGQKAATASATPLPTGWGAGPFSGDVWVRMYVPVAQDFSATFTIDSTTYASTGGMEYPYAAIYGGTCSALSLKESSNPTSRYTTSVSANVGTGPGWVYARIVSASGKAGYFNATLTVNLI